MDMEPEPPTPPDPSTSPTPPSPVALPSPSPSPVAPPSPPQPAAPRVQAGGAFAALAKHLVMQERMKAAGEELPVLPPTDNTQLHKDPPKEEVEKEEELPFEVLEERAKAGDAKAQTNLGRYFLKLPVEGDAEVNNSKAVDWLIQAAKQGCKDAAKLLRHCLTYKKGITPENEEEMKKLASETKFERAVRKAAMMMYWKLNPDRKKKVAVSEMLGNVGQVNSGCVSSAVQDQQRILQSMVTSKSGNYVELEDFVEITKKFTQGIAPSSALGSRDAGEEEDEDEEDEMRKSGDNRSSDEKDTGGQLVSAGAGQGAESAYSRVLRSGWGLGRRGILTGDGRRVMTALDIKSHFLILQHPLHALVEMKDHLMDWASRAGMQWLSTIIPTHHVNALIFFFIISNLTIDFFAFLIPLLIFYLSFASMVICTLRVFQNSKSWENFRALAALLTRFEPSLDLEQAEANFGWNNLEPYLYFLLSVLFVVFSFPVADRAWIPCSELAMAAVVFTVASYASLSDSARAYARRALAIEVLSSACALTARLPQRMAVARLLGATFATVPLGEWVELRLSAPCLLYLYLFYLFFRMAQQRGFRGTYCFLVPYLVCFTWCEFSVALLQSATPVGLIRTCVACFLFLFALPVLALGLAALLLVQAARWLLALELTKLLVTLAVCAVPVVLRLWTRFSLSLLDVPRALMRSSAVKLILAWVSVVLLFCWAYVLRSEGLEARDSTLSWRQYGDACGPRAWREASVAQTQILCSHAEGQRVTWTGRFKGVAVAETENGPQSVINLLPAFAGDWLRCLYGEAYPECRPEDGNAGNASAGNAAGVGNASGGNAGGGNASGGNAGGENAGGGNASGGNAVGGNAGGGNASGGNAVGGNVGGGNAGGENAGGGNASVGNAAVGNAGGGNAGGGKASTLEQKEEHELCRLKALTRHDCHVKRFDNHRFEVTVGMPPEEEGGPDHDIVLWASGEFRQVLLNMDAGSVVEFSTVLEGRLGSRRPVLELLAVHCLHCRSALVPAGKQCKIQPDWNGAALRAARFAFDFFFSPFLSVRIGE